MRVFFFSPYFQIMKLESIFMFEATMLCSSHVWVLFCGLLLVLADNRLGGTIHPSALGVLHIMLVVVLPNLSLQAATQTEPKNQSDPPHYEVHSEGTPKLFDCFVACLLLLYSVLVCQWCLENLKVASKQPARMRHPW